MTAITAPTGAAPAVGHKSSPVTDTWYLTGRKLHALVRQPVVIAFGVVQPAIWLFLFGELFRKVIDIPGFGYHGSYLAYLVPGIVAMNAMSNNMWAGMTLIEEIDRGTLNRLLVTPASRLAIMNASVAEQAVGTIVQTLIIVGLAMAGGARYPGGVAGVAIATVAAVLVGILWGALSNMTGMLLRSREAIIGVYTFFMLPLMFLSSAFMQPDFMPGWMQAIASRNPLNWEVQVGRAALSATPDWAGVAERCGGLLALAVLAVIISVTTFRSYAKNALSSGGIGANPPGSASQGAAPPSTPNQCTSARRIRLARRARGNRAGPLRLADRSKLRSFLASPRDASVLVAIPPSERRTRLARASLRLAWQPVEAARDVPEIAVAAWARAHGGRRRGWGGGVAETAVLLRARRWCWRLGGDSYGHGGALTDVVAEAGVADQQAIIEHALQRPRRRLPAAAVGLSELVDGGQCLPGP